MSLRKVHKDKKGLYVTEQRRKYRPPAEFDVVKGDEVHVWGVRGKTDVVRVTKYGPVYQATQTGTNGYTWQSPKRDVVAEGEWTTTDEDPRIREKLKKGQSDIRFTTGRGQVVTVIVGDDGYDHGYYRKDPGPGWRPHFAQGSTRGTNVMIVATKANPQLTWDEWDALVAAVEDKRHIVPIAPIAAQLEEEVKAEDMLQAYMEEKGLA